MSAAIPLWMILSDQSQPRFMNERSRLQGLVRTLLRHFRGGELAQFVVHERQQLIRSLWVALLSCLENARDIAHAAKILKTLQIYNVQIHLLGRLDPDEIR